MNELVRGGLAGILGTVLMTLVIAGGRAARLLWTPPPREITHNVAGSAGVRRQLPESAFQAAWLAAHLGYGAACGVVYAAVRPRLPAGPVTAGLVYGGAVWGVSYLGLMPALGLYPWPKDDSGSRMAVMIAAHAVFGTTIAAAERRL